MHSALSILVQTGTSELLDHLQLGGQNAADESLQSRPGPLGLVFAFYAPQDQHIQGGIRYVPR
jgi:hypothetical protein